MNFKRFPKLLIAFTLALSLFVSACTGTTSAPPQGNQSVSSPAQPVATQKPVSGGSFNKFFPKSEDEYKVVFAQEKTGFAEAKLNENGENIAMLSINDVANTPSAATKYKISSKTIEGFPAVTQGTTATAILVANRYQVKVQSRSDSFDADDREEWIGKFDLQGLSKLK